MINEVNINYFKCFKSISVPLKPLTVLIGPNDTGKSVFMEALCFLKQNKGIEINHCWRLERRY